jgi:hypothetical protein
MIYTSFRTYVRIRQERMMYGMEIEIWGSLSSIKCIKKDGQTIFKNCTVHSQENGISLKNPVLIRVKLEQEEVNKK